MKQILQELGSGKTLLADVPEPAISPGSLRILTRRSLISAGTERMLIEFGRAGWVDRARRHPERVQQVLNKVRTDGLAAAAEAVNHTGVSERRTGAEAARARRARSTGVPHVTASGLSFPALSISATDGARPEEHGVASGLFQTSAQFGTALLIAVTTAVTQATVHPGTAAGVPPTTAARLDG